MQLVTGNVPAMDWEEVKVYIPNNQYKKMKEQQDVFGDFINRMFGSPRVEIKNLEKNPSSYLYLAKMSSARFINRFMGEYPVNVIYSMWQGYLDYSNKDFYGAQQISAMMNDDRVNFVYAHTTGHATVEDLKRIVEAIKPKKLIPVHTERADDYQKQFENVVAVSDGTPFVF